MSDMPVEPEQLRSAVTHEVRQQMSSYVLKVDMAHEDLRLIKWTLYGNKESGEPGMVSAMQSIVKKLDDLADEGIQRKWMLRGIAAGLAVNLAASTGILEAVGHFFKVVP